MLAWVHSKRLKLWTYLTGDKKAVVRAFTSLLALWAGAGGFSLSDQEIVGAAIGLGLLVPQRAQQSKPVTLEVNEVEFNKLKNGQVTT